MIYYIYKVRRKQTSIHFSRFTLLHRYLRSISWNGGHRPQPSTSWVFPPHTTAARDVFAAVPIPQGRNSCDPISASTQKIKKISPNPSTEKKKKHLSSLFPHSSHTPVLPCCYACVPSHALPAIHPRPVHSLLLRPSHKCGPTALRREPAHHKKCRLLAQESTRRHAWLTRSCFGRKNLFIDGPHSLLPFFLSPFLQRKRKKKTEANSAGSNTSLGLTSFVLTMYAIGPSRLVHCNLCSNCDPFRARLRRRPRLAGGLDGTNIKV